MKSSHPTQPELLAALRSISVNRPDLKSADLQEIARLQEVRSLSREQKQRISQLLRSHDYIIPRNPDNIIA